MHYVVNTAILIADADKWIAKNAIRRKEKNTMATNTCCCTTVRTTNVQLDGTTLVLTIPNETLFNGMTRTICIVDNIPDYTGVPNVAIKINGTTYTSLATNVINHCGKHIHTPNNLYVDQLRQNPHYTIPKLQNFTKYTFAYATDTQCWNLLQRVHPSCGAIVAAAIADATEE